LNRKISNNCYQAQKKRGLKITNGTNTRKKHWRRTKTNRTERPTERARHTTAHICGAFFEDVHPNKKEKRKQNKNTKILISNPLPKLQGHLKKCPAPTFQPRIFFFPESECPFRFFSSLFGWLICLSR